MKKFIDHHRNLIILQGLALISLAGWLAISCEKSDTDDSEAELESAQGASGHPSIWGTYDGGLRSPQDPAGQQIFPLSAPAPARAPAPAPARAPAAGGSGAYQWSEAARCPTGTPAGQKCPK